MQCAKCNAQITEGQLFCSACGTKNEIKADIEESESKSNKDKYIKYKVMKQPQEKYQDAHYQPL